MSDIGANLAQRMCYAFYVVVIGMFAPLPVASQSGKELALPAAEQRLEHDFNHISSVRELRDGRTLVVDRYDHVLKIVDWRHVAVEPDAIPVIVCSDAVNSDVARTVSHVEA